MTFDPPPSLPTPEGGESIDNWNWDAITGVQNSFALSETEAQARGTELLSCQVVSCVNLR